MPKCAVQSCKNSTTNIRSSDADGISFFQCPRDPTQAEKWWKARSPVVSETFNSQTAVVCSEHFQDEYKLGCNNQLKLADNAVPDTLMVTPVDVKLTHRNSHNLSSYLGHLPPDLFIPNTVNNNQIFTEDINYKSNIKYAELLSGSKMDLKQRRKFTEIVNNLIMNNTEITIKETKSNIKDRKHFDNNIHCGYLESSVNDINVIEERYMRNNLEGYKFDKEIVSYKNDCTRNTDYLNNSYNKHVAEFNTDITKETCINNNLETYKSYLENYRSFPDTGLLRNELTMTDDINSNFIEERNIESDTILTNNRSKQSNLNNNLEKYDLHTEKIDFRNNLMINTNEHSQATIEANNVNIVSDQSADQIMNLGRDFSVNNQYNDLDEDSSSDCLVIDAGDEEMETVISSEYVSRTDGGMPIDELIDIYNNNGDGDEILQELNQQFQGSANEDNQGSIETVEASAPIVEPAVTETQTRKKKSGKLLVRRRLLPSERTDGGTPIDELIDIYNNNGDGDEILQELNQQFQGSANEDNQGDVVTVEASAPIVEPTVTGTQTRKKKCRRAKLLVRKRLLPSERAEYCLSRALEKVDRTLFTITTVSDEDQIAEVLKRQETYRFKRAPFKCGLCFRSFTARRAHDAHMRRHDKTNGAYECVICKARQKTPRAVRTHMYGQHTVRFSCNKCTFVTMNRSVARSHEKWHAGTIHQCPYCPEHYDQESTYKAHLRTQHVHAHACAICGLTFVSAKGLAVHRCKRHGDAHKIPLDGPHCAVCEVRFATHAAYTAHLSMSSRHRTDNVPRYIGLREAGY